MMFILLRRKLCGILIKLQIITKSGFLANPFKMWKFLLLNRVCRIAGNDQKAKHIEIFERDEIKKAG